MNQLDPNYTYTEMRANVAEATAIRALCYFHLIRTFRDVPFTREPTIDDTGNLRLPATKFEDVLDSLILDLETVKDEAVRRYYTDDNALAYTNSSRITRPAIYALLADLYLWKGDWDKCISSSQYVIDFKKAQYEEMLEREGNLNNIDLINGYPLILERPVGTTTSGNVYNEVFGTGNSFESLFELYFRENQSVANSYVPNFYMRNNSGAVQMGNLAVNDEDGYFYGDMPTKASQLFVKSDCRAYESLDNISSSTKGIAKYARQRVSFNTQGTVTATSLRLEPTMRSTNFANWIVYRLTDVMLMKAEALVQTASSDSDKVALNQAYDIVNVINQRSLNEGKRDADTLHIDNYPNKETMELLVLAERERELCYEGKRWFDLVRFCYRHMDGVDIKKKMADQTSWPALYKPMIRLITRKYLSGGEAVSAKMKTEPYLYWPVLESEIRVNKNLQQNPVYELDKTTSKN